MKNKIHIIDKKLNETNKISHSIFGHDDLYSQLLNHILLRFCENLRLKLCLICVKRRKVSPFRDYFSIIFGRDFFV